MIRPILAVSSATIGALTIMAASTGTAVAAAGDTTTTFSINGGALSVTVQTDATLNNAGTGATSISGQLGNVSVTDNRGGTANWSVNATSTAFSEGLGPDSTAVSYNAGAISETGVSVILDGTDVTLTGTAAKVAGPTAVTGNNTASWNPTLTVTLPGSALAGDYTGTVNTSIS